jgi:hypothetical protein
MLKYACIVMMLAAFACGALFALAAIPAPAVALAQAAPDVAQPPSAVAPAGFWASVWVFLNSAFGITLSATIALAVLGVLSTRVPALTKLLTTYRGDIIAGIKFAEKTIPDTTPNKSLARLDAALKYVIAVIEETERRDVTPVERAALKSQISVVHDDLSATGTL